MIKIDEDSLICDLAETYKIYDYRQLPILQVAVFACGLRENSRIKMKMSGRIINTETLLLASITDLTSLIWWSKTKDALDNRNRPKSLLQAISGYSDTKESDISLYHSGEDFEKQRNKLIEKLGKEGLNVN